MSLFFFRFSGADSGFPGGANRKGGANLLDICLGIFFLKLHENEEIWTERGRSHPKCYYVDPPLFF